MRPSGSPNTKSGQCRSTPISATRVPDLRTLMYPQRFGFREAEKDKRDDKRGAML